MKIFEQCDLNGKRLQLFFRPSDDVLAPLTYGNALPLQGNEYDDIPLYTAYKFTGQTLIRRIA